MKKRLVLLRPSSLYFILIVIVGIGNAHAQTSSATATSSGADTAADKDRIIADLQRRVEALERKLANISGTAPAATPTAPQAGRPAAQATTTPSQTSVANEPADEETNRALERTLVREGGLVLPPKTFEIEPGLIFQHRSSVGLRLINSGGQGQITQQDLKNDATGASLALRLGLPWATQLEAALPYFVNRETRVLVGSPEETDRASGFGNFQIGLTKQLLNERPGAPGLLGSLQWRTAGAVENFGNPAAVGSSFRALQGTLTVIKRRDPLVFFGSVWHAINYSRTINGSKVAPGNASGLKAGSIFATSPDTSMRIGFEYSRSRETEVNGIPIFGSDTVIVLFNAGYSFVLSPRALLAIDAGFGLTQNSPNFRLGVSLPIRF